MATCCAFASPEASFGFLLTCDCDPPHSRGWRFPPTLSCWLQFGFVEVVSGGNHVRTQAILDCCRAFDLRHLRHGATGTATSRETRKSDQARPVESDQCRFRPRYVQELLRGLPWHRRKGQRSSGVGIKDTAHRSYSARAKGRGEISCPACHQRYSWRGRTARARQQGYASLGTTVLPPFARS